MHVLTRPASGAPGVQRFGGLQTVPQAPQLLLLIVVSTQMPLQSVSPAGHLHWPAWHVSPPVQALPHLPQSRRLACRLTHEAPHAVSDASVHVQAPVVQVWVAPQRFPQVPQLVLLVDVSTHVPLHLVSASGQPATHMPPVQTKPAPQALPHMPQLVGSEDVSTHVPPTPASLAPQSVVFGGHPHAPPVHCMPPVQALPHFPQSFEVVCKLTHAPLQRSWPLGHLHVLDAHIVPPLQTTPHPPQF